ncbi:hypothetical protein J27TS7_42540 [Paenibacillus dendritiformis]|nr:hypothetical protein J27TS7_42540 [Paenibacillus dendritiformis]
MRILGRILNTNLHHSVLPRLLQKSGDGRPGHAKLVRDILLAAVHEIIHFRSVNHFFDFLLIHPKPPIYPMSNIGKTVYASYYSIVAASYHSAFPEGG